MAEKKPMIVIKKITVVAGGGHGGAWKVAFADFMTAMMAFFLVMWILSQSSEAQKKAMSDYFSTPSVIEYQFSTLGVEMTLEKLFLDLVNEPLKTLEGFVTPMDKTPNVMGMGMKKVAMAYAAEQLGAAATNVNVTADTLVFEIPDHLLFEKGNANPGPGFVTIMERVKGVTAGLEDSDVIVTSVVFRQPVGDGDPNAAIEKAKSVSEKRLDLVEAKVRTSIENESVDVKGRAFEKKDERGPKDSKLGGGYIRFEIKQKEVLPDGRKPKPLQDSAFGKAEADKSVYDNFVKQVSKQKKREPSSRR